MSRGNDQLAARRRLPKAARVNPDPWRSLVSDSRSLDFRSDNVAGAAPEVIQALIDANRGADSSYGDDAVTQRLETRLAELFEHEVAVFTVATGSAANALALAQVTPGWGAILCHREAHIATDECAAPEFFTTGAKLVTLDGDHGKLSAAAIAERLSHTSRGVHHSRPAVVSISQSTEAGTCYRREEVAAIGDLCRGHNFRLHMDGARLANALVCLGSTPADITWRAGVDILSFGLTKNGAMAAEAVIFFDPSLAEDFAFRRKRGGHLFSKMRFVSAQFEALLSDGAWLRHAAHANAMARRLADRVAALPDVALLHPVEANELFLLLPEAAIGRLEQAGFLFYRWDAIEGPCIRLVTAFDTGAAAVDAFADALRKS
jgi:threonine aldolase